MASIHETHAGVARFTPHGQLRPLHPQTDDGAGTLSRRTTASGPSSGPVRSITRGEAEGSKTLAKLVPDMNASDTKAAKTSRLPPEGSAQTPTRETLALDKLVTKAGTQVRSEISEYIVAEYLDALREGARFPPVVVFRSKDGDVLADGFHRVQAYQQAGRSEIEANVHQGGRDEALWFALGANRAHGQRLSRDEKRFAIEIAYRSWPDVSQVRIAAQVGCNQGYVGKVRAQLNTSVKLPDRVVGRDGRERPATRPPRNRQAAKGEDDAAPATGNQRPDRGSDAPQAANAQTRAASPNEAAEAGPKRQGQAPVEPAGERTTESDPTGPGRERSGTGVTAKQSARDRSNRIVSVVTEDAKNLTAQDDLIDFTALDRTQLPKWIDELEDARRLLGRFIRKLRQEVENGHPSAPIAD